MKKSIILSLTLAAALGFTSCSDENIAGGNGGMQTFSATIENGETRTALQTSGDDQGKVYWVLNDEISINGTRCIATEVNGTSATFEVEPGQTFPHAPLDAYYPYAMCEATCSPELPSVQVYDEQNPASNAPMHAYSTTDSFVFRNLCGLLRLKGVTSDKKIHSIRIQADQFLSGPITVVDNKAVIHEGKHHVRLSIGDINITTGKDFYVAIPEGTYTNLQITFTANDGKVTMTNRGATGVTITRNMIKTLDLSSHPVPMDKKGPETYYGPDGRPIVDGEEGENTGFDYAGGPGRDPLQIIFSNNTNNPIFWDQGDGLEWKVTQYTDMSHAWDLGDATNTSEDGAFYSYEGGNKNWWKIGYKNGSSNEKNLFTADNVERDKTWTTTYWLRLNQTVGLQISLDGETYYTAIAPNDQTYLPKIWARGSEVPLYFGNYLIFTEVHYDYIRQTRAQEVEVTGISLSPTEKTIDVGDAFDIVRTIYPVNATNREVTWESDDETVATVDATGQVRGVGAGTAVITATTVDGDFTATCTVTVNALGSGIYYYGTGGQISNPIEGVNTAFELTSAAWGPYQLPVIDWNNGGYIEYQITKFNGGCPLILGTSNCFPNTPNYSGRYSLYMWPAGNYGRLRYCDNGTNAVTVDQPGTTANPLTIKIYKDNGDYKVMYKSQNTKNPGTDVMEWAVWNGTIPASVFTNNTNFNLGCGSGQGTGTIFNYFKVVESAAAEQ